jgi:dCTP deaminase
MILSAQSIRKYEIITPFHERTLEGTLSFGLSSCGYDVRIDQLTIIQPQGFRLASIMEHIRMPDDIMGIVHDKSSWARRGLTVQNTVIEPGWSGYLTIELTNHSENEIRILSGTPIAQIVFHLLDEVTEQPYQGKYQNQERGITPAK